MKWLRFIRKLKPYNIQKGLRYLKHYGPKGIPDPSFGEDGAGGGSVRTVAGAVLRQKRRTWRVKKIINFLIVRRSALLFRLTVRRKFFCVR